MNKNMNRNTDASIIIYQNSIPDHKVLVNEPLENQQQFKQKLQNKSNRNENIFNKLFLRWVNKLISIAQTKILDIPDLDEFQTDEDSQELFNNFYNVFNNVTQQKHVLVKVLFLTLRIKILEFIFWQLIMVITQFSIPILIREIIQVTQNQQLSKLYCQLVILLLIRFISNISMNISQFLNVTVGNDAYTIVAMAIMDKSLRVSFLSNLDHKSGQVINLLQVDALKLQIILQQVSLLILSPVQIAIAVILLFYYIGIEFVGGFLIILIFILINAQIGKYVQNKQKVFVQAKDERMNAEILAFQQIKFIKINAYESLFAENLQKVRQIECQALRYRFIFSALCVFTSWFGPILIFISTFCFIYYSDKEFTIQQIFLLLNFISMLQPQIILFPQAISEIKQLLFNLKRIEKFLFTTEIMTNIMLNQSERQASVNIQDGYFYWPSNLLQVQSDKSACVIKLTLKDINLQLNNNKLVAIIGDIGSGKSSLIYSILGEMLSDENISNPIITKYGRLAYVGQRPWVMNATVKDNILFGFQFDTKRYQEVLRYSQLEQDLQIFPQGDLTMIGEKGVNISGGQKTRIAIARALYSDADIIILDDPLSAVDAYVGNYLMNECFIKYLNGKLRILITHNLCQLRLADQIIVMTGGVIEFKGNYDEFRQSQYYTAAENYHYSKSNEFEIECLKVKENNENSPNQLMIAQDRHIDGISLGTFKEYFNYTNGSSSAIFIILVQLSWILSYVLCILDLLEWSKSQFSDNGYYLKRYIFYSILQVIFVFLRPFSILQNSVDTSKRLHNRIIQCLFKADLCNFFERVPVGRILNVLSKDLNILDQEMYWSLNWFLAQINLLISNVIIYIYSTTPLVILPISLYIIICNSIKKYYMKASTELKRLESITKGQMISFFSEFLINGLISIRAYNKQSEYLQQHSLNLDKNRKALILLNAVKAWFMARLGVASLILNIVVIMYYVTYMQISPASIALILSFATALDSNISNGFEAFSQYQLNFVAFENCHSMTKIEPEKDVENVIEMKAQFKGNVEFKDFSVRYRPNLPPALKKINLIIHQNEKIGVVGRTGAGKSTITLSLLRVLNGFSGNLYIDGQDVQNISLKNLRENITMIMQEPNLFTGTIKQNLDPFSFYDDQAIINAIEKCCLSDLIRKRGGVDCQLSDGGKNLSEGERQLLCIARAVLKKSKIILIDEATANIDLETDKKIQNTIQDVFRDCTVITIAHRVSTILYCDKILLIENGEVAEFEETNLLLQNSNSRFSQLYNQSQMK